MWATAVGWAAAAVLSWIDQWLYPPLEGTPSKGDATMPRPRITVLVPARNEERNIEGCVLSVLNQTYPDVELIVINDQSTDRTGELLDEMARHHKRLQVIHGEDLPEGWIGKGWALYQGHRRASGDWIVLLDADVRLEPWALERCLDKALGDDIDFLNPWPFFVNVSFWERVMQPLLWGLVRIRFPLAWVNAAWSKENMAFGPMIMVRKAVYDEVDGHRHVAMDILEDVALARLIRSRGYRTMVVNGKHVLRVRMYTNLRELISGWTKTAYGAMNYKLGWMTLATLGVFWAATQPFLTAAYGWLKGDTIWLQLGFLQIVALAMRRIADARESNFELWTILMHPLAMLVVHYMQVRAVWSYYFGAYTWKGRAYRKPRVAQT